MRFGVIVNRSSRDNHRHADRSQKLAALLGADGVVYDGGGDGLDDFLRECKANEVRYLGVCGGDGTQHLALSRALSIWGTEPLPFVVPLRGGTMNTIASSIGVARRSSEALLSRVLERDRDASLRYTERLTAQIEGKLCFLFGVGAVHGFLAEYYRDADPNALSAARTLSKAAAGALSATLAKRTSYGGATSRVAAPFSGRVEFQEGGSWEARDYLAVTGGTIEDIGLGFSPFPQTRARGGVFQLLGVHGSPAALAASLPRLWRARPLGAKVAYETLTAFARLVPDHDRPYGYMMDGDLYEAHGPLEITAGPRVHFAW